MSTMHQTFDAKAEECFQFLDINKDGTLSIEELWKGFEKLRIPPPSRADFCKEVHLRENKRVTKEDFKEYTEKQYQKVKNLFNTLDLNKDGKITSDEIVKAVRKYDPNVEIQESDLTRLFLKVDRDHKGSVDFEEWCELLILIPNLTIKTVINYWRQVIQLTDDFTLYGIHRNPPMPVSKEHQELKNWLASFSAGMFAGVVSRTSMAPLDRLKLIYQVYYKAGQSPPSIAAGLKELYRRDGFKGLFRGNLMTISRAGPETSLKLTIFEKLKSLLPLQADGKPSKGSLFIAGSIAGVIANVITFPLGVLRTRLAAAPSGTYKGITDCVVKMRKNEGAITPFYRGLTPALIAIIPNSGLNLMSYEVLKKVFIKKTSNKEPSPIIFMVMGGLSALFSNTLLYPLQITTSRLVMQGLLEGQKKKGMVEVMKKTYKSEGYLGFYKGYRAAITKIMLGNAISFGCFEFMKRTFGVDFRKRR